MFEKELNERNIKLNIDDSKKNFGGTPEDRISKALQKCYFDEVIAWLDNDKEIEDWSFSEDLKKAWCVPEIPENITLRELKELNVKNKKPHIVLALPLSIENVIITALGKENPEIVPNLSASDNVKALKSRLNGIFGFKDVDLERDFYFKNLKKKDFIKRAKNIESLREFFEITGLDDILN